MVFETIRLPSQNKALHCYLLMTMWILLLIAGVYKFLEPKEKPPEPAIVTELFHNLANDIKTKRIFRVCNLPKDITDGDEGILESEQWLLKGLIVLIRHGDRGPFQHVRNISAINCGIDETERLNNYKIFLNNLTTTSKWLNSGAFHGFPLLPTHPYQCQLGQLTMQGVEQLLKLGELLHRSYERIWPKLKKLTNDDVQIYSTRYRRTFQSALAFLYSFLPHETVTKLTIIESHSMNFCFKDCGCPVVDKLMKSVKRAISYQLKSHPAVASLTEITGRLLFSPNADSLKNDPHTVRDALLTYICHNSNLPCETVMNCIKRQNIAGVFTYTDWVNYQKWHNINFKYSCLLKSYGLIRHIVQQMLYIVTNNGPFFVFYSGHDHTIEQLTTTLGLHNDPLLLRYGARIVFEIYQNKQEILDIDNNDDDDDGDNNNNSKHHQQTNIKNIYFRLLTNGRDVTKQIQFCKNLISLNNKVHLCKIEDIVRFIHDDYFTILNVTNFKDACNIRYS